MRRKSLVYEDRKDPSEIIDASYSKLSPSPCGASSYPCDLKLNSVCQVTRSSLHPESLSAASVGRIVAARGVERERTAGKGVHQAHGSENLEARTVINEMTECDIKARNGRCCSDPIVRQVS